MVELIQNIKIGVRVSKRGETKIRVEYFNQEYQNWEENLAGRITGIKKWQGWDKVQKLVS